MNQVDEELARSDDVSDERQLVALLDALAFTLEQGLLLPAAIDRLAGRALERDVDSPPIFIGGDGEADVLMPVAGPTEELLERVRMLRGQLA